MKSVFKIMIGKEKVVLFLLASIVFTAGCDRVSGWFRPGDKELKMVAEKVAAAGGKTSPGVVSPSATFRRANHLYGEGKYEEAAAFYEHIRRGGWASASLYYNLGNAYFKEGDLGRAILNYRRAWNLSPRDPEINKNLQYARENLRDDVSVSSPGIIRRIKLLLVRQFPLGSWLRFSSAIYYLTALWVLAVMLIRPLKRVSPTVLKTLLLILALGLIGSVLAYSYYRVPRAIILDPEVSIRYGPDEKDAVAFELHEGTEVSVIRKKDGWNQISLPDGKSGWLPSDSLGII